MKLLTSREQLYGLGAAAVVAILSDSHGRNCLENTYTVLYMQKRWPIQRRYRCLCRVTATAARAVEMWV